VDQTRDAIEDIWGQRTPHEGRDWPSREDARVSGTADAWIQSACVLCSAGCALDIGVREGRIVGVRGRTVDRVNRGRLGPKGLHGWEANASRDRLTTPLINHAGRREAASWDEAMSLIVKRVKDSIERYTPGSIGFYNTGQLFLEEYYTLSLVAEGGIGTGHLDGNTRLCTATAATALIESFGTDGAPGSLTDIDVTDALMLFGHNMASTQTVIWSRVLDRLAGPNPPKLLVVDPRRTVPARHADIHLAPKLGTNLALLNGLLNLIIAAGHIDAKFVNEHTVGFEELQRTVVRYPAERVSAITGLPVARIEEAAEFLGTAPTLVSTALQGVYQSLQATASAVQINNLHLIRGMIGKPGCTVFQMNGQPTAQNTRECGANGELVAFRNWNNPEHVKDLARVWNVDPSRVPHWNPPTHAMEIFRYAETGSIRVLWIIGTNPAVSMPELRRIRSILGREGLFVVVQDAFLTETAELADVVLPAAIWGEKTGCFTNVDRTVHISHKAIEPPGEARSDLEILIDFAGRMDLKDKDGAPLVKWHDSEGAFVAWQKATVGRVPDYTGLSYPKLSEGSGIQWPVNAEHPDGTERLYTDGVFHTAAERCETYGHDLMTGAPVSPDQYKAVDPKGRAWIKAADYAAPPEEPDEGYPLLLTTGRVAFHFHTRTKTGRAPELEAAAPSPIVQLSDEDGQRLGIVEGDLVEVSSRRGSARGLARIGGIEPGMCFMSFHFGEWDRPGGHQAANELTLTGWDPVSKQPWLKYAAVRVEKAPAADEPGLTQRARLEPIGADVDEDVGTVPAGVAAGSTSQGVAT
jgi:ferredoxin-nitrate reductase